MDSHAAEPRSWARHVAAQLRLLQLSCADKTPAQRQDALSALFQSALKQVPAGQYPAFFAVLVDHFLPWQNPETQLDKPEALSPAQPPCPASQQLQQLLALTPSAPLDRPLHLLELLVDTILKLDQVVWLTWEQLPPRPDFHPHRGEDLKELFQRFCQADPPLEPEHLKKRLDKSRRLIVALLASLAGKKHNAGQISAGKEFAKEFLEKFFPTHIQDMVQSLPALPIKRLFGHSAEHDCWLRYMELFKDYSSPEQVDKKLKDAVVKTVEKIAPNLV